MKITEEMGCAAMILAVAIFVGIIGGALSCRVTLDFSGGVQTEEEAAQ